MTVFDYDIITSTNTAAVGNPGDVYTVGGGWSGASWTPGGLRYTDPYQYSRNIFDSFVTDEFIKTNINTNNYGTLIAIAEQVLKRNRKLFNVLEKAIVDSKDFNVISQYIKTINNIDVSRLTSALIAAYQKDATPANVSILNNIIVDVLHKLDAKRYVNFVLRSNNPDLLEFLAFGNKDIVRDFLLKVPVEKINKLALKSKNPYFLLHLAKRNNTINSRAVYKQLKKIGDKEFMARFIEEIDDDWVKALRLMK